MAAKDQSYIIRHFGLQLVEHCVRYVVLKSSSHFQQFGLPGKNLQNLLKVFSETLRDQ